MDFMQISDDLGRPVTLHKKPERIISLVPSVTKTICDLGGEKKLVGVTNFCKYPENIVKKLPKLGGPKKVKTGEIFKLEPDLIFAVKEENSKDQIEELSNHFQVFVFDINSIEDALRMIRTIAVILGNEMTGDQYIDTIKQGLQQLETEKPLKSIYLIWKDPWMAAGNDTFIGSMMKAAGLENIIEGRYPQVTNNDLARAETILLSSEPYHFKEKERKELESLFPDKSIINVDGEIFSWYGTKMKEAPEYFKQIIPIFNIKHSKRRFIF
jgi:ABC-type Fe3+-hydroxamate transport system substrate-binding protein